MHPVPHLGFTILHPFLRPVVPAVLDRQAICTMFSRSGVLPSYLLLAPLLPACSTSSPSPDDPHCLSIFAPVSQDFDRFRFN